MRSRVLTVCVLVIVSAFTQAHPTAAASSLPAGFSDAVVQSGLLYPTAFAFAPGGRLFIAEQRGVIKTYDNLNDTTASTVADLRTKVLNNADRGLLGMVVDPQFPNRPYLYVHYVYDAPVGGTAPTYGTAGSDSDTCPSICPAQDRVARLTLGPTFQVTNETVLTKDVCSARGTHEGGGMTMGSDGSLYVTFGESAATSSADYGQAHNNQCGDPPTPAGVAPTLPGAEGGALRSQDVRTASDPTGLSGALIRIDPDTGAAWPENPFIASADVEARKIVAYGFRNPFRITRRPNTDDIYVGDVGWTAWEEIDRVASAAWPAENFGWPCYEGVDRQPNYDALDVSLCENLYSTPNADRPPFFTYHHEEDTVAGDGCRTGGGGAITGLAFYGGTAYPAAYRGALFFQDLERRCMWFMAKNTSGVPNPATTKVFARGITGVDLRTGPGGDLFYLDVFTGSLNRIHYDASNTPPTAQVVATPSTGVPPLTVFLDGRGSFDPDPGATITYAWDTDNDGAFDDGGGATRQVTFSTRGSKTVRLRVRDEKGATNVASTVVTVGRPPVPTIDTPSSSLRWASGQTVSFSGHAVDPEDGPLAAARLSWSLILHHCSAVDDCHQHHQEDFTGSGGSFVAPDHEYLARLELQLTATDSDGVRATTSLMLDARVIEATITSEPPGLTVAIGSTSDQTPFTVPLIVGSSALLTAVSPQVAGGVTYLFDSWSMGGPATQQLVVPATDQTYAATFEDAGHAPIANAGPDFAVGSEKDFVLDGSGSTDQDGDPLTYRWTQIGGPVAVIPNDRLEKAQVEGVKGPAELTFRLTVTDTRGLTSTDTILVTVRKPK